MAAEVVGGMRPGPALAYWIDQIQAAEVDGFGVIGATTACHRLASRAQAKELGFVAQTASRAAASNQHIAVGPDGRRAQVPAEAAAEAHHKIKGLPGWHLRQLEPGVFEWCSPSGRRYVVEPDSYPV